MDKHEIEGSINYDKKTNRIKFRTVNHSERAFEFHRITDYETSKFLNIALEYFDYRCAITGERFVEFDKAIIVENEEEQEETVKLKSNLSAEHMIPLCRGGDDIVPNLFPTIYQYNVQKNGYYPIDYWKQAKDINGNSIYSPFRLLKVINYMLKSSTIEARECVRDKDVKKFKKLILMPNEIDRYLKEKKESLFSDTETGLDENKRRLKKLPSYNKGEYIRKTEGKYKITEYKIHMMDIFLHDAIKTISKEIGNEEIKKANGTNTTISEELNQMFKEVKGNIPFEVNVRDEILNQVEKLGIKENKYTVANEVLLNTDILELINKEQSKEDIRKIIIDYLNKSFKKTEKIGLVKQKTTQLISINPKILFSDKELEETSKMIKTYCKVTNKIEEDVNLNFLTRTAIKNLLKIQQWMENNNRTKPPSISSKDYIEKGLGIALSNIRQKFVKPYLQLEDEESRKQFESEHPELQEILQIVNWMDENNLSPHLINARQIKTWMETKQTNKPPRLRCEDKEEQRLGTALQSIRRRLINPYLQLESENEKIQFEEDHPELQEILQIVNWIDENNLSPNLVNARQIKIWMEDHETIKPPSAGSKNEEERKLGLALTDIRRKLIKPYKQLQTGEEKMQYEEEHPELQEVLQIVNWIDENNLSPNLVNARQIKIWMEKNETTKPPTSNSKDEEEKKLGGALQRIRHGLVKQYLQLETEEERLQYEEEHTELQEVLQIINWIDENNISPYLVNARLIKEWVKNQTERHLPRRSRNIEGEEKELAKKLGNIRQDLIKPYLILQTEEERTSYREQHPELDEVMSIISELDIQCGNKKQQELAILIRQDLEKRKALQEAKKLEKEYEQQLSKSETKDTQKQGVDFNE